MELENEKLKTLIDRVRPKLPPPWEVKLSSLSKNPMEDREYIEFVDFRTPDGDFITFSFEFAYGAKPSLFEIPYGRGEGPPEFWKTADLILKEAKALGIETEE